MKDNDKKIEQVATASLVPYAKNAKKHDAAQVAAIAGSIREFGFNNPVLIDGDNGIIAGHGRVLAAHQLGLDAVPCLRLTHLSDTQKRAYILADNRLAELGGGWDAEMLAAELDALSADGITMEEIGFDADALEELGAGLDDEGNPEADAEPQINKAEELRAKWGVETGQLWELGEHRLLCGDSTKKEDVDRAMGGDKIQAMVTDPPYGTASENKAQIRSGGIKTFNIGWDKTAPLGWIPLTLAHLHEGAAIVCFWDNKEITTLWNELEKHGYNPLQTIYWKKPTAPQPRKNFCSCIKSAVFARNSGKVLCWNGGGATPNCFDVNRAAGHERVAHETQKPLSLFIELIELITTSGFVLYEPFSGSGTTIIACEQLGRKCRAIEISPAYVAVALQRWADATGKTPKLVA
jgi:DNA modification methylase